jgi:antirestriction protein ArdC
MHNFRSNPAQRRDHYQQLTDKIVAALEAGTTPWRRPWDPNACGGSTMPVNAVTGPRYRGVNLLVLGMSSHALVSNDPRWCSYRQAATRGWQVRINRQDSSSSADPIRKGRGPISGRCCSGTTRTTASSTTPVEWHRNAR